MFKKCIVLVLLFTSIISFSQETVSSFPLDYKNNRDVFQIVNEATKKVTFFASDRKEIKAFLLNDKMQITDSIKSVRPENKYADIAGFNGDKSSPRLFWVSEDHKEIYSQYYNFENHTVSNQEYVLKLKDEKFVQYFSENKLFYIVTIIKESNILKFYVFDVDGKMSEKTIDFTGFRFLDEDNHKLTFYGILREFNAPSNAVISIQTKATISLQKISPEDMTSLTYSSNKRKCYLKNNLITISIDLNPNFTQLIFIDLNTFTAKEKFITKPFIANEEGLKLKSNSFLINDKLYQIKLSPSELKLSIKTLDDILIKEYAAIETEAINFKNSDILQKKNSNYSVFSFDNDRVLEKTKQFLRKVHNSNCAISCYDLNGSFLIRLGSFLEQRTTNSSMGFNQNPMNITNTMSMNGSTPSGTMSMTPNFNYANQNFNSYKNSKEIFINCLFDKDNIHLSGELKPLAFDKIQDFLSEKNKKNIAVFSDPQNQINSETVFKIDATYYFGDYNKELKKYIIRKFTD